MNPYINNSLDNPPITHSRLNDNPEQHSTSSTLGGAATLSPFTSHQYTSQTSQNETQQAEFAEVPQLLQGNTQENLENPDTWSTETVAEASRYICNNPHLVLFGLGDDCDFSYKKTSLYKDDGGDNEFYQTDVVRSLGNLELEENSLGAYQEDLSRRSHPRGAPENPENINFCEGRTMLTEAKNICHPSDNQRTVVFDLEYEYFPINCEAFLPSCERKDEEEYQDSEENVVERVNFGLELDNTSVLTGSPERDHSPLSSVKSDSCLRKPKVYEWPQQSDPEKEMRRKRAVKEKNKRDRVKQEMVQLQKDIDEKRREVNNLTTSVDQRRKIVLTLRKHWTQQDYPGGQ